MSKAQGAALKLAVCPMCDRLFYIEDGHCPDCGWPKIKGDYPPRQEVKVHD